MIQFNKVARLLTAITVCAAIALPAVAQPQAPAPKMAPKPGKMAPAPKKKDEFRRLVDNFGDTDKKIYKGMTKEEKDLLKRVAHMGKQVTNTVR